MKTLSIVLAGLSIMLALSCTKRMDEHIITSSNLIDYQCVQDCMSRGYMYGYCQKKCSF